MIWQRFILVNACEYLVLLGDKLSVKKINIKKTFAVKKKIKCKLCQECHEEFEMLKFEFKIEIKNWKKILQKKDVVKIIQPIRNIMKGFHKTHIEVTYILLGCKAFWFIEIIWFLMHF